MQIVQNEEKQKTKKQIGATGPPNILGRPVYFPHIPREQTVGQNVELTFPRRGKNKNAKANAYSPAWASWNSSKVS